MYIEGQLSLLTIIKQTEKIRNVMKTFKVYCCISIVVMSTWWTDKRVMLGMWALQYEKIFTSNTTLLGAVKMKAIKPPT